ncbi:MAG: hypothetical protein ACPGWR_32550, partial [Ardenticatenaceae bacterium]
MYGKYKAKLPLSLIDDKKIEKEILDKQNKQKTLEETNNIYFDNLKLLDSNIECINRFVTFMSDKLNCNVYIGQLGLYKPI